MSVVQQNNIDSILEKNISLVLPKLSLPEYYEINSYWFLIIHNSITKQGNVFQDIKDSSFSKVCAMLNGDSHNVIHRLDIAISTTNKKE